MSRWIANELRTASHGVRAGWVMVGALIFAGCIGDYSGGRRCFDSTDCPLGSQCTSSRVCIAGPPVLRPGQRLDAGRRADARAAGDDGSTADSADDAFTGDAQHDGDAQIDASDEEALDGARAALDSALDAVALPEPSATEGGMAERAVDGSDGSTSDGSIGGDAGGAADGAAMRDGAGDAILAPSDASDGSADAASADADAF